jgi:hypothetical protein
LPPKTKLAITLPSILTANGSAATLGQPELSSTTEPIRGSRISRIA